MTIKEKKPELSTLLNDELFKYFFYFIDERMKIFHKRSQKLPPPYSKDIIFNSFKFTNAFRILDRNTQYELKNIINPYTLLKKENRDPKALIFEILLYKFFNKISTYELIKKKFPNMSYKNYPFEQLSKFIQSEISNGTKLMTSAYMMTFGKVQHYPKLPYITNSQTLLLQVFEEEFIKGNKFDEILSCTNLNELYKVINKIPNFGDFLAYQYTLDLNYIPELSFNENNFCKAGIGTKNAIQKLVPDRQGYTYEDIINYTFDNFDELSKKFGYNSFPFIENLPLTKADIEHCFCETNKYLGVKIFGHKAMKNKYNPLINEPLLEIELPPMYSGICSPR
jgi:hypothetical protein